MIGRTTRGWTTAAALPVLVAALVVTGCGGSNDGGAAQASSEAPAATAPATAAPATTAPAATPAAPLKPGTAAAGKQVFAATCAGCHAGLGTRAGFGPKLAGLGLSKAFILTTVTNGRNQMPAGLVHGQDLADIVAYVSSLQ